MKKSYAAALGVAKFSALWTAAVFLLTTPALLLIQGGDALLPYEAVLTSVLSIAFFGWSIKTAVGVVKL